MTKTDQQRMFIVVDLDGTLCDTSHRDQFATNGEWDEFHSRLMDDEPYPDVEFFLEALRSVDGIEIVGCTGRTEKYRKMTEEWLIRNCLPMDHLIMRPDFDFSPAKTLKPDLLDAFLEHEVGGGQSPEDSILFILEDQEKMVEAWRINGFNCWQVRNGGY